VFVSVPSVELHEETREDMIWSGVKTEQIKQQMQVAEDYGRPQTLILEQICHHPRTSYNNIPINNDKCMFMVRIGVDSGAHLYHIRFGTHFIS